jgi:hypothetical protein
VSVLWFGRNGVSRRFLSHDTSNDVTGIMCLRLTLSRQSAQLSPLKAMDMLHDQFVPAFARRAHTL